MLIKDHCSLRPYNTFGIEASCTRFVEVASAAELQAVLPQLQGVRLLAVGEGSNLLFTADFDGTVLHTAIMGKEVLGQTADTILLRVGAGEHWDALVEWCGAQGFYGLENLSGIPGQVGAAAVQNIGAYGAEVADFISTVETVCLATGEAKAFPREACAYGYRRSAFKTSLRGQYVVTHVTFRLSPSFTPNVGYAGLQRALTARGIDAAALTAKQLREVILAVRNAKLPQPAEVGSAGSFFMNPVVSAEVFERLREKCPDVPHYVQPDGIKIPAAWLIEQTGWKGRRLGDAGVWPQQALVLVNYGNATGSDIVQLAARIAADVVQRFGIALRPEVNYI